MNDENRDHTQTVWEQARRDMRLFLTSAHAPPGIEPVRRLAVDGCERAFLLGALLYLGAHYGLSHRHREQLLELLPGALGQAPGAAPEQAGPLLQHASELGRGAMRDWLQGRDENPGLVLQQLLADCRP